MIPAFEPAPFGITPKLIKVLADPVRLRILKEVQRGEVSSSDFAKATGVELGYASRCFRQLAEAGYLEILEERRSRRGGARREQVYRETRCPILVGGAMNPISHHPVVDSLSRHVEEGIEKGILEREESAWLVYMKKELEKDAWEALLGELEDLDRQVAVLEAEAAERLLAGESEPIMITIGLSAVKRGRPPFLASRNIESLLAQGRQVVASESADALAISLVAPEVAKSLSNRWRSRILTELTVRALSPSQFVEEVGGDPSYIARCFRELDAWGLAEVTEERKGGRRGGGVERIYRIARLFHFDDASWRVLPRSMRKEVNAAIMTRFTEEIGDAIRAGGLATPGDHRLTCRRLMMDDYAWQTIRSRLWQIYDRMPEIEQESISRNGGTVEGLVPALIGLIAFPSPVYPR